MAGSVHRSRRSRSRSLAVAVTVVLVALGACFAAGVGTAHPVEAASSPDRSLQTDCRPCSAAGEGQSSTGPSSSANAARDGGGETVRVSQVQCQVLTDDRWVQYYAFHVERSESPGRDVGRAASARLEGDGTHAIDVWQAQCQRQNATGTHQVQEQTLYVDLLRGPRTGSARISSVTVVALDRRSPVSPANQSRDRAEYLPISVADGDPRVEVRQRPVQRQGPMADQVQRQDQRVVVRSERVNATIGRAA